MPDDRIAELEHELLTRDAHIAALELQRMQLALLVLELREHAARSERLSTRLQGLVA